MNDEQLQTLLADANPLTSERARDLSVADAQDELLAALMADAPSRPSPSRVRRTGRRRVFARVGMAVAATAAVLIALVTLRGDSDQGSGTAWAAEQVRFAEASPLVLLGAPGWRVEYADEGSEDDGELKFRRGASPSPDEMTFDGEAPIPADTNAAQLTWVGGGIGYWLKDRAASAVRETTAPVLGTTARVYQYDGGTAGHRDITALFRYDGRVLEFRAGAADVDAFKTLLATLERVDTNTWLSALPGNTVKVPDRDKVVEQMLRGVTVPPGFDAKRIEGAELTKDRYQLGAAVVGTVACEWFKRWGDARAANDAAKEREAIAAMAGAKDWPILAEMAKQGDYPAVLLEFAAAMPSGDWHGRPLLGDVETRLGCEALGVKLP